MAKQSIVIDVSGIKRLEKSIPFRADRGIRLVADTYAEAARETAPRKTGALTFSFKTERHLDGYKVYAPAMSKDGRYYGDFQELGTGLLEEDWKGRPRPGDFIRPKRQQFMKFEWHGKTHFRKKVVGVKAKHFQKNALDEVRPYIGKIFAMGFERRI